MKQKLLTLLLLFASLHCMAQEKLIDSTTEKDNTYGSGGTKTKVVKQYSDPDDKDAGTDEEVVETYKDSKGHVWQRVITATNSGTGRKTVQDVSYDANGDKKHFKEVTYDALGNVTYSREEQYNGKNMVSGTRKNHETGKQQKYNPKTFMWDDVSETKPPAETPKQPESSKGLPVTYPSLEFALGPSWLHFGDPGLKYDSWGGQGEISYFMCPRFGVNLAGSCNLHKETNGSSGQHYSQTFTNYFVLGGLKYSLLSEQVQHPGLALNARAGYASYQVRYNSNNETFTQKEHSFSWDVDVESFYNFLHFAVIVQLAYTPTYLYSDTQNNYAARLLFAYFLSRESKKHHLVQ